ncbi:MAG: ABC transporter ATP-binding protein [Planctomycetes bacterium]|nr:ABC transporter ATP-binding protein [Planctomycetota bacterium]
MDVRELTKRYGPTLAVDRISFRVSPGETVGYLGPNGAGKTTTLKILCGMLAPSSGAAVVAGQNIVSDTIEVKRHIGFVPDSDALYEGLTPYEFLRLVGQLHDLAEETIDERVEFHLRRFGMIDQIYEPMSTFSKGMKQKIVLTSAFLHEPQVLFLDEPLTGLDVNATLVVKDYLQELARAGRTIFYSSHLLDVVQRVATRVIMIHRGRIVLDGAVQEVLARAKEPTLEEVFRALTQEAGA